MKYTVAEVHDIVEQEGLGYTIHTMLSPKDIADPVLETLWADARELLMQIEQYIDDNHNEPFDIDEDDSDDDDY